MTHLIHAPLKPRDFHRWAAQRGMAHGTGRGGVDDGHALHVLLSALFGKGAAQPFRLFAPERGPWALYAYAQTEAATLARMAREVGAPEALAVLPPEALRSKPMPENLAPGKRLGFDLRARPVRRVKGRERDAFLYEAERDHAGDKTGMAQAGRDRAAVYRDWLAERLDGAAALETARMVRFQRHRAFRGGQTVEGPDATLQGVLTVTEPARLAALLARGVGRHVAFGYGMLLLRPPDRPAPER